MHIYKEDFVRDGFVLFSAKMIKKKARCIGSRDIDRNMCMANESVKYLALTH